MRKSNAMARLVSRESSSRKLTFDDVIHTPCTLPKDNDKEAGVLPGPFGPGDEPIPSGPKLLPISTCSVKRLAYLPAKRASLVFKHPSGCR